MEAHGELGHGKAGLCGGVASRGEWRRVLGSSASELGRATAAELRWCGPRGVDLVVLGMAEKGHGLGSMVVLW
ncbi:hypothetical protein M0R45_035710 [Rubus argutus]|uniref:Uncharacterized protein n=1 Tax=Rubus argutus TaxID=59490 RepID=A0AAW1VUU3_RUBAR